MSEQSQRNTSLQQKPCPICGGMSYTWGRTVGESPNQWIYFRVKGEGWGGGKRLFARECNTCGNVQLFTRE